MAPKRRAEKDPSTSLAGALKNQCSINKLSPEILGYIFEIGVKMDTERKTEYDEDELKDSEDEDEGEDGDQDEEDQDEYEIEDEHEDEDEYEDVDEHEHEDAMSTGSDINAGGGRYHLFQVLASHVCRYWREVALHSPVLWTKLYFDNAPHLNRAKAFIDRAHGLPLDIWINCTPCTLTDEDINHDHRRVLTKKDLMRILDLIEPEVSHWEKFGFAVALSGYTQSLLSRLHNLRSAPLLKDFQLLHPVLGNYEFFHGNYLPFHGNAPLLEFAMFWGIHIDWDNSLHFLRGLRKLQLAQHAEDVRPSYITFTKIIKNSPDLHHLELIGIIPSLANGTQFDDEPFDIPCVHNLVLRYQKPPCASTLIQHFHFPNLHDLLLDFSAQDYSSFVRQLSVPVKGQSESILSGLETLQITALTCNVASIETMLQQLTKLKCLHLSCPRREERMIFRKLIDPRAGRVRKKGRAKTLPKLFCPALETLVIEGVSISDVETLIKARKKAGAPLKTLKFIYKGITANLTKRLM